MGKYTLSLKLKVDSANVVGIRMLAHESNSVPDSNQEFIMCDSTSSSAYANTTGLSATTRSSQIHADYDGKTLKVNDATGSTSLIKVINISQDDNQAGYSSSDEYIEFFPVDNTALKVIWMRQFKTRVLGIRWQERIHQVPVRSLFRSKLSLKTQTLVLAGLTCTSITYHLLHKLWMLTSHRHWRWQELKILSLIHI